MTGIAAWVCALLPGPACRAQAGSTIYLTVEKGVFSGNGARFWPTLAGTNYTNVVIAAGIPAQGADYYSYFSETGEIPWSDGKLGDDQFAVYHPSDGTYWTAQAFTTLGSNDGGSGGGVSAPGFSYEGGGSGGTVPIGFCGGTGRLSPVFTEIIIISRILPPATALSASPDPIAFGQAVTLEATTVSPAGTLSGQAIDNSADGISWIFGATVPGASWTGGPAAQNTLAWTFVPPSAGTWLFRAAGTDSVGVSNLPQVTVPVGKATPAGSFAGQSLAYGRSLAGLLSAVFSNPYSTAVVQPTGAVAYTASGLGPVSGSTVLPDGDYTVTAAYPGDSNYNAAAISAGFTVVSPAPPTASISASPSGGMAPLSAAVSWSTSNASSAVVAGSGVASSSLAGTQNVTLAAPGTYVYSITASGPGGQATKSASVTAGPARFVLTTIANGNGAVTPGGSYPPGSIVSITATPGNGAGFSGWTGGAAGSSNPLAVTMNSNLTIYGNFASEQAQTIDFSAPATENFPGPSIILAAIATSGLPVQFSLIGGPAVLRQNMLSFTGPGAVVVQASQGGNGRWLPAPPVTASIQVNAFSTISRVRFNPSGNDARAPGSHSTQGGTFLWTDPAGLQSSPWPSFGGPQPIAPVQKNTGLPEVPAAVSSPGPP